MGPGVERTALALEHIMIFKTERESLFKEFLSINNLNTCLIVFKNALEIAHLNSFVQWTLIYFVL